MSRTHLGILVAAAAALAVLASTFASKGGAETSSALAPSVSLSGGSYTTVGKTLSFLATTTAKLTGPKGKYFLQLRGIELLHPPLATFKNPDYLDGRRCTTQPCQWGIAAGTASTYELRAFLLDSKTGAIIAQSQSFKAVWAAAPQPHAIKVLINGKKMPTLPLNAGDSYQSIAAGRLRIEAQWTTNARSTGYQVVISTSEPKVHDYVTCSVGTSCVVPQKVAILANQEMSWVVRIVRKQGNIITSGARVCLIGRP